MARRKRKYVRHAEPVEYKLVTPAALVRGTSRAVGSLGRVTPRMLEYAAHVLAGVSPVDAASMAGYAKVHEAARKNAQHQGLLTILRALLARHGVTTEFVAQKIAEQMGAERTVMVAVTTDDDSAIIGKELVREADNAARGRATKFAADLLGMTPCVRACAVQGERATRAHAGVLAPCDLSGDALAEVYAERLRKIAEKQEESGRYITIRDHVSGARIEILTDSERGCLLRGGMSKGSAYHADRVAKEIAEAGSMKAWQKLQTERWKAKRRRQGATGAGVSPTPV